MVRYMYQVVGKNRTMGEKEMKKVLKANSGNVSAVPMTINEFKLLKKRRAKFLKSK